MLETCPETMWKPRGPRWPKNSITAVIWLYYQQLSYMTNNWYITKNCHIWPKLIWPKIVTCVIYGKSWNILITSTKRYAQRIGWGWRRNARACDACFYHKLACCSACRICHCLYLQNKRCVQPKTPRSLLAKLRSRWSMSGVQWKNPPASAWWAPLIPLRIPPPS